MLVVVSMLLNAVAVAADGFERWRPATVDTPLAFVRRALPVSGSIGSGLAALCLGCVLVLARFGGSSRPFDVEHSGVEAEVAAVEAAMTFLPEVEATELGVQDVAIEEQVQTPAVSPETGASFEGLDITTEDGLLVH